MRNSAARKIDYTTAHKKTSSQQADILDMEAARVRIAEQANAACNLTGNKGSCDFEDFMTKYDIRPTFEVE
jgi:hypothetical protein